MIDIEKTRKAVFRRYPPLEKPSKIDPLAQGSNPFYEAKGKPMLKIYLAAQYHRRDDMKVVAEELRRAGHIVTASWLDETEPPDVTLDQCTEHFLTYTAEQDMDDIRRADIFVLFSVDPLLPTVRGGRHVEMGYALGLGKPVYVVGPKENIFYYLPGLKHFSCISELIDGIKGVEKGVIKDWQWRPLTWETSEGVK